MGLLASQNVYLKRERLPLAIRFIFRSLHAAHPLIYSSCLKPLGRSETHQVQRHGGRLLHRVRQTGFCAGHAATEGGPPPVRMAPVRPPAGVAAGMVPIFGEAWNGQLAVRFLQACTVVCAIIWLITGDPLASTLRRRFPLCISLQVGCLPYLQRSTPSKIGWCRRPKFCRCFI